MASILVVDDEAIICDFLANLLGGQGHEVAGSQDGESALEFLAKNPVDLVITDHRMEPMDGMELMRQIRHTTPTTPVILISGYGASGMVIDALKEGVFDFLAKPVGMDELQDTVQRALRYKKLMAGQIVNEEGDIPTAYCLEGIVAESPSMKEVCKKIQQVASVNTPVLISGPEASGKGLVAETIHRLGRRADQPFAEVDCAAETEESLRAKLYGDPGGEKGAGLLFTHSGGTLHLRRIEASSAAFQKDLFDVLETRKAAPAGTAEPTEIDTRIIASTAISLIQRVGLNQFRPELYARLARVSIELKPLAERPEDVLPLFIHMLRTAAEDSNRRFKLDEKVCWVLHHHPWPGNADELQSLARQVVENITDEVIGLELLPPLMVSTVANSPLADPEKNREAAEALRGVVAKEFLRKKQGEYKAFLGDHAPSESGSASDPG